MNLTRRFQFDAAHRILGHAGKCAHLHGHTYHLEVTVGAEQLDGLGMVVDFDDLRTLVQRSVLDHWDHATLLAAHDPLVPAIAGVQSDAPERLVQFKENPTAEIMTRHAWLAIRKALPAHLRLVRVKIEETPACFSELTQDVE